MPGSVGKHDAMQLGMESTAVPRSEQLWRLDRLVMQRSCDAKDGSCFARCTREVGVLADDGV